MWYVGFKILIPFNWAIAIIQHIVVTHAAVDWLWMLGPLSQWMCPTGPSVGLRKPRFKQKQRFLAERIVNAHWCLDGRPDGQISSWTVGVLVSSSQKWIIDVSESGDTQKWQLIWGKWWYTNGFLGYTIFRRARTYMWQRGFSILKTLLQRMY